MHTGVNRGMALLRLGVIVVSVITFGCGAKTPEPVATQGATKDPQYPVTHQKNHITTRSQIGMGNPEEIARLLRQKMEESRSQEDRELETQILSLVEDSAMDAKKLGEAVAVAEKLCELRRRGITTQADIWGGNLILYSDALEILASLYDVTEQQDKAKVLRDERLVIGYDPVKWCEDRKIR